MKQKSIATAAIFTSLIVVLTSLSYVIPGIELSFIFFLPFFSSYISFKFGFKRAIPFLIATFILSSLISYIIALLYIFPALVSGLCFGYLSRKINRIIDLTFIMSFIEAVLFALSIALISNLFATSIEEDLSILFNVDKVFIDNNKYLFLFIIGIEQSSITGVVIYQNYQKLNLKKFDLKSGSIIIIFNVISMLLLIIFRNNQMILRLAYGIYFVTLLINVISSINYKFKYNWIFIAIQIFTFLFICIPVLTIISDSLKLFVYSWFLLPYVIKNSLQVFNFIK